MHETSNIQPNKTGAGIVPITRTKIHCIPSAKERSA